MTQHQKPARHESENRIAKGSRRGAGELRAEAVALAHGRGCRPESVGQLLMEGLESGGITVDELDEIVETLRSLNPGLAHAVMGGGRFERQLRARSLAQQIQADSLGDVAGRLPEAVLRPMEWALGADFGGVRVREGAEAEALGAEAFARGEEIVFAPGRFEPGTVRGRELIGHELVHVMQQRSGRVVGARGWGAGLDGRDGADGVVSDRGLESEADRLGGRAARGERTAVGWARGGEARGGFAQLKEKEGAAGTAGRGEAGNEAAGKEAKGKVTKETVEILDKRFVCTISKDGGPHGRPRVATLTIEFETAEEQKGAPDYTLQYIEGFEFALVDGALKIAKDEYGTYSGWVQKLIDALRASNKSPDVPSVPVELLEDGIDKILDAVLELHSLIEHPKRGGPLGPKKELERYLGMVGEEDIRPNDTTALTDNSDRTTSTTTPEPKADETGDPVVETKGSTEAEPCILPPPRDKKEEPKTPPGGETDKKPDVPPGGEGEKDKPEAPKATVTGTNIEVNQKILFATDDDKPAAESRASLDGVAKALNEHPEIIGLRVEGHTDSTGKPEHNQDLSERRANKVRDHLRAVVKRAELQMGATGFGQSQPVASNKTKEGRARNRRVVFSITKKQGEGSGGGAAVQKRAARGRPEHPRDVAEPGRVARRGLEGEGDTFPFVEQIQEAFGGYDLGSVRAHMDALAIEGARELRAEAYASGEQVAFAQAPDLHTAAHEAAHVVQQRAGVSLAGGVGQAGDRYERHADQVADAVVSGRSAEGLLSRMAGGGVGRGVGGRGVQRVEAKEPTKGEGHASSGGRPEGVDEEYRKTVGDAYYAKTKTMSDEERTAFFKDEEYRQTVGDAYYEKTKTMSDGERRAFFQEEEYRLTVGDEIYGETRGMSAKERTAYLKRYEAKLRGKLKPKRKPTRKDAQKKLPPQIPGCEPSEPAFKGEGPGPWAMDDGWKGVPFKAPESGGACAAPGTSTDGAGQSSEGSGLVVSKGAGAPVQAKAEVGRASLGTDDVTKTSQEGFAGAGGRMPFLERIQAAFGGHDIAGVRAHSDAPAREASKELGAEAYASGEAVAFAKAPDLHTAAHEAAHVVQQRAGVSLVGGVGQVGDRYEQHADEVADAVMRGESAEALLGPTSRGSRADAKGSGTSGLDADHEDPNVSEVAAGARSIVGNRASGGVVQRFAPELHEEATATGLAGSFSAEEIGCIYQANWERDFSQGAPELANVAIAWAGVKQAAARGSEQAVRAAGEALLGRVEIIIELIGSNPIQMRKGVSRLISDKSLGGYAPVEHIDRPDGAAAAGGASAPKGETPSYLAEAKTYIKAEMAEAVIAFRASPLVEKSARDDESEPASDPRVAQRDPIRQQATKLAEERGAASHPIGNPERWVVVAQHLGRAMHAMEDFWSHSNWLRLARQLADWTQRNCARPIRPDELGTGDFHGPSVAHALGHKLAAISHAILRDRAILARSVEGLDGYAVSAAGKLQSTGELLRRVADKFAPDDSHAKMANDQPEEGRDAQGAVHLASVCNSMVFGPLRKIMDEKDEEKAVVALQQQQGLVEKMLAPPSPSHPLWPIVLLMAKSPKVPVIEVSPDLIDVVDMAPVEMSGPGEKAGGGMGKGDAGPRGPGGRVGKRTKGGR